MYEMLGLVIMAVVFLMVLDASQRIIILNIFSKWMEDLFYHVTLLKVSVVSVIYS